MKSFAKRLADLERLEQLETVYGSVGEDGRVWVRGHTEPMTRADFEEQYGPRGQLIVYEYVDIGDKDE